MTQKIHFTSPILALRDKAEKLGKASLDTFNQRGWLKDLLKNWFVEDVASEINDFKCIGASIRLQIMNIF